MAYGTVLGDCCTIAAVVDLDTTNNLLVLFMMPVQSNFQQFSSWSLQLVLWD